MVQEKFAFNPERDLHPVDQFGFIDLKTALSESVVPSQLPETDSDYNGIQDPDEILGRPRDVFEAIDTQKAIEAAAAASAESGDESADQ